MKHSTGTPVGFHVYKPGKGGLIRGEIGMSRLDLTSRFWWAYWLSSQITIYVTMILIILILM
ncbi:hypothetical protein NC651_000137 [Populus alba x Populus x berolinensis]|nr:hypothetical protein NC651_000137 [Populus alba x Populus x berolinensis]